jgi:hypothetical protein
VLGSAGGRREVGQTHKLVRFRVGGGVGEGGARAFRSSLGPRPAPTARCRWAAPQQKVNYPGGGFRLQIPKLGQADFIIFHKPTLIKRVTTRGRSRADHQVRSVVKRGAIKAASRGASSPGGRLARGPSVARQRQPPEGRRPCAASCEWEGKHVSPVVRPVDRRHLARTGWPPSWPRSGARERPSGRVRSSGRHLGCRPGARTRFQTRPWPDPAEAARKNASAPDRVRQIVHKTDSGEAVEERDFLAAIGPRPLRCISRDKRVLVRRLTKRSGRVGPHKTPCASC